MSAAVVIVLLLAGVPSVLSSLAYGQGSSPSPGDIAYMLPYQVVLGNVSTSFRTTVYVPVYLINGSAFSNLSQVYSYDGSLLRFEGVADDVASQTVTFTYRQLAEGMLQINGSGYFVIPSHNSTLYYLEFQPLVQTPTETHVILDSSKLGSSKDQIQSASTVLLAYGWVNLGPSDIGMGQAGTIPAIGFSPENLNILYVGSGTGGPSRGPGTGSPPTRDVYGFGGVFRSNDVGATWHNEDLGLTSTEVNSISVLHQNPDVLVVITGGIATTDGGGIYKSVNGGNSWQETYNEGGDLLVYYSGSLYAASYHALLVSHDFGTTWHVINTFPGLVTTFAVQSEGQTFLVGESFNNDSQILKSVDGGASFQLVGDYEGYNDVSQILTDPSNQSQDWALINHGYTSYPNLFKSNDGGSSWTAVNDSEVGISFPTFIDIYSPSHFVAEAPQSIAVDPLNGNVVLIAGPSYLYRSDDGGSHFTKLGSCCGDNRMIAIDPQNDSIVFLGSDQGIYVSHDGGVSWTGLNNLSASLIYSVAAQGNNIITVAQDFGPIVSHDDGRTWGVGSVQGGESGWDAVDPYNQSVIIVDSGHVVLEVSHDGGNSFFAPSVSPSSALSQSSTAAGVAFGSSAIYVAQGGGIFASYDWGSSWTLLPGSPQGCQALAIDPIQQTTLYASGCSSPIAAGILKSTDAGATWTKINDIGFQSLAVDPSNDSIIAGVTYSPTAAARLLLSENSGTSFTPLDFPIGQYIFTAPPQVFFHRSGGLTYLILITNHGLFASADLGANWVDWSYNLPAPVISSLEFTPQGGAYLSTYGTGVWYDSQLFNPVFQSNRPLITGKLPPGSSLSLNGTQVASVNGYFEVNTDQGSEIISLVSNDMTWRGVINVANGSVYFIDFSADSSALTVVNRGLAPGASFRFMVGGQTFNMTGGVTSTLEIARGNWSYAVSNAATDYEIFVPHVSAGNMDSSFLPSTLIVRFAPEFNNGYENLSGLVQNGPFWTETMAHNEGYELLAGGGSFALLNLNTSTLKRGPPDNSITDSSIAYKDGFLLGGRTSVGATLYFYNITDGVLTNLTSILPPRLQDSQRGSITGLDLTTNGNAVIIGSGQGVFFMGLLSTSGLRNLTQFIPHGFIGSPAPSSYFGVYMSKFNAEVIVSNPNRLGVLFLGNDSFEDFSSWVPFDAQSLAQDNTIAAPMFQGMSSNGSVVFVGGIDSETGGGFEALFSPTFRFREVTNLFPSDAIFFTASWNGHDFFLSGVNRSSTTPPVYSYNPETGAVTRISYNDLTGFQLVDSIDSLSATESIVAGFEVTAPPGVSYVVLSSKYAAFNLNATGIVRGSVSPPTASVILGGVGIPVTDGSFYEPEFSGSYDISVSTQGYATKSMTVNVLPFSTISLDIQLSPLETTTSTTATSSTSARTSTSAQTSSSTSAATTSAASSTSTTSRGAVPESPFEQGFFLALLVTIVIISYLLRRSRLAPQRAHRIVAHHSDHIAEWAR